DEVWKSYESGRGMDQDHDLHDWLGGYPYESASAEEITSFMRRMGFSLVRSFDTGPRMGVLGTGCAEYVFQRMQQVSEHEGGNIWMIMPRLETCRTRTPQNCSG